MIHPGVLISIVNHENTSNALSLASRFGERAETLLIDSGSLLSEEEKARFDALLPNVYYSGLFNETRRRALARTNTDALLFVCSDVLIDDPAFLVDRLVTAFSDPTVGVYTPSHTGRGHAFCHLQDTSGLREIPFVDGFIIAIRLSVLSRIRPIDLDVNPLGWGLDAHAGYLAASMGLRTVVDDLVSVYHPAGSGYDRRIAYRQMLSWFESCEDGTLLYYKLYRRLRKLSRFRLSRLAQGVVSPFELKLFRWIARAKPPS